MAPNIVTCFLLSLSAAGLASSAVLAERRSSGSLEARSIRQGWSLQASTCPVGINSCGSGSCCPSSLSCNAAKNDEVASCCSPGSTCVGSLEGAPACADSSWSLWQGLQGNGFCCPVGQVGVFDYSSNVAGSCVASSAAAGASHTAILRSSGNGNAPTTFPTTTIPQTSSTSTKPTSTSTTKTSTTSSKTSTSTSSSQTSSLCPNTTSTMTVTITKTSSASSSASTCPTVPTTITKTITITATSSSTSKTSTTSTSTKTTSSTSTKTTSTSTTKSSATSSPTASINKPVFFHYLIGTLTDAHCEQDVIDAQNLGADGFILNLPTDTTSWAQNSVASLFKYANQYNFKLFFSFDMTDFSDPSQFTDFLISYVTNGAYYYYNGLPMVTTFNGGASQYTFGQASVSQGWQVGLKDVLAAAGHPIYFIPAFQDVAATPEFFDIYPVCDGAMNWNSWPFNTQGDIIVPTTDDVTYQNAAKANNKSFMMGLSPLQFKHIDGSQNYYRRGEENLEYRFGQVLNLQPDLLEIQTWNDAGESHYMGNSWPEPIAGTDILDYTVDYDHTGYWQILPSFIHAWKSGATTTDTMYPTNGAVAQGVFWHHTLLTTGTCNGDNLGQPDGFNTIEDKVQVVVLVQEAVNNLMVQIESGGMNLGMLDLAPGYNFYDVYGLQAGNVTVTVSYTGSGAKLLQATGPLPVVSSTDYCNWNFQVVGLSA